MKKLIFIITLVILSILIWNNFTKNKQQENRTEVVVWTLQMSSFSDYINDIIKEYESKNPTIKIKWIDVPFSEGEKRILASILSNNPPDLVNLNPDFSAILAQKGALETIPAEKLSNFNQDILNSLSYKGKLFGIPWYATSAVTIYNKELIQSSDLPKRYDDLLHTSTKLKTKKGVYIFFPTITESDTMLKILNKYGVNSPDNIAGKESIRVFNMFRELYKNKLIPPESITQTHQEALEKYMSGNIAIYQGGANFLSMIKDNAPNVYKNTEVAPQMVGKLGQNDFSLMNFIIPLKSKHKKEALDFCLYLTNADNQIKLAKMTNVIATNRDALKNDFYNSDDDIMARARKYSAKQLLHVNPGLRKQNNQKDINLLINTAVQRILLGQKGTEETLEQLAKDWNKLK